jgi:hypothetical protein
MALDLEQVRIGLGKVLLDPVRLQQQTKYKTSGLTVTSNDENIMPRDAAGNIIFHESSSQNPLLIIEPVDTKIMLRSVLKVLDTRFEYFKFPVTTTAVADEIEDLAVDLTIPDIESPDIVYARYKPSENLKLGFVPAEGLPSARASGILMDEVVEGALQTNVNAYYVTKEIKDSGVDLRFRAKINHRFDSTSYTAQQIAIYNRRSQITGRPVQDFLPGYVPKSNIRFFISRQGPNTPLNRAIAGPFAGFSVIYTEELGSIAQDEVRDTFIDVIIYNEWFEAGDYFGITQINTHGLLSENDPAFHTINSEQTYWVITDASKNVDDWNQEIE